MDKTRVIHVSYGLGSSFCWFRLGSFTLVQIDELWPCLRQLCLGQLTSLLHGNKLWACPLGKEKF